MIALGKRKSLYETRGDATAPQKTTIRFLKMIHQTENVGVGHAFENLLEYPFGSPAHVQPIVNDGHSQSRRQRDRLSDLVDAHIKDSVAA